MVSYLITLPLSSSPNLLKTLTGIIQSLIANNTVRSVELPLVAEDDRIADAVSIDGVVLSRVIGLVAGRVGLRSAGSVGSGRSGRSH